MSDIATTLKRDIKTLFLQQKEKKIETMISTFVSYLDAMFSSKPQ